MLFDISYCKCVFNIPVNATIDDIPCTNTWKNRVLCQCPIDKRVDPNELPF